ncbi:hypothetical protein PISMIDRAFT_33174, partial [Pisolithus microcarpus 441]
WIWADWVYPMETWCVVLFKKPQGGSRTPITDIYQSMWKVHIRVEHAFAALKGHFQSLWELRLHMGKDNNLHIAVYWITTCIILHNMIVHFEETLGKDTTQWAI